MLVFQCPHCQKRSVAWDARAQAFLCYNAVCRSAFPPPAFDSMSFDDVVVGLSLNRLPVTQEQIDKIAKRLNADSDTALVAG